jgi:hypothetical protein
MLVLEELAWEGENGTTKAGMVARNQREGICNSGSAGSAIARIRTEHVG